MKKIITIILSLAMVMCFIPATAFAESISGYTVNIAAGTYTYNGSEQKPAVTVKNGENTLESSYYKVDYTNNVNAGTATATVTGKNGYEGTASATFDIVKADASDPSCVATVKTQKVGTTKILANDVSVKIGDYVIPTNDYTIGDTTCALKDDNTVTLTFSTINFDTSGNKNVKTVNFNGRYDIADYTITPNNSGKTVYPYDGVAHVCAGGATVSTSTAGYPPLILNTDYTLEYSGNIYAYDTPEVKAVAKADSKNVANFTTTNKVKTGFRISRNIADCFTTFDTAGNLIVRDGGSYGTRLESPRDYTVSTSNRKLTITGTGSSSLGGYYGSKEATVDTATIDLKNSTITFSGFTSGGYPTFAVTYGGITLRQGTDYTLTYIPQLTTYASYYTVSITAISGSNYYGYKNNEYISTSSTNNIANCTASLAQTSYNYTGYAITPAVTVYNYGSSYSKLDSYYYTVNYYNNISPGQAYATITGRNGYTGSKTLYFTITNNYNLSNCTVTLSQNYYTADGYAKTPTVTVKDGYTTLSSYSDYYVEYRNNTTAGQASVVLTGRGKYLGTSKTVYFTITGLNQTITGPEDSYTKYPGFASFNLSPKANGDGYGFSYVSSDRSVATVSSNGLVDIVGTGIAKITISTVGDKKYNPATKVVTVTVKPKKPAFRVTAGDPGEASVRITKVVGATKYQIRYGRAGSYKSRYATNLQNGYSTQTSTLTNLRSGKAYYVKIRSYKTLTDGTKVWGNWTSVKKVVVE